MQGRRREDLTGEICPPDLQPGDYWRHRYGEEWPWVWWVLPPETGFSVASLLKHEVVEHEDGTITVSPSILAEYPPGREWHGYLERGVWRAV